MHSRAIQQQKKSLMKQYYNLYLDNSSIHVEFKPEQTDVIFQAKCMNLLGNWTGRRYF